MIFFVVLVCLLVLSRSSSLNGKGLNSFGALKKDDSFNAEVDEKSVFGSKRRNKERENLYEAYNLLHTLAQVSQSDIVAYQWQSSDFTAFMGNCVLIDAFK